MKIYIQAIGSYKTLLDLSLWCENNNIERIGLPDHYIVGSQRHNKDVAEPALDLIAACAGLLRDTKKMIYSMLISPITFRHPSVLVKMASTINEMAKGRFRLGIGTGWLETEHELYGIPFPDLSTRFEMLEEYLIYTREALSGNENGFKGKYYQLEKFPIEPSCLDDIPIIVGGGGKIKTPTLAGKYSEEFNIYAAPKKTLKKSIELFKSIALEHNRDIDSLEITTACPPVVGMSTKSVETSLLTAAKTLIQPADSIVKNWKERDYLLGTPEDVAETLTMWEEVGINAVYLQFLDLQKEKRNETVEVVKKAISYL